jgi:uncharacterized membrane protein
MRADVRNNKDFWGGAMLLVIGAAAMIIARGYPFGSMLRMGPGYFPMILGAVLCAFGLYLAVRGLRSNAQVAGSWSLRALIVLPLAFVLFGILMTHAGFIPALMLLIFGSAAGGREFKFVEVAILTLVLTMLCVAVFIFGLGLPYPLLAGF